MINNKYQISAERDSDALQWAVAERFRPVEMIPVIKGLT